MEHTGISVAILAHQASDNLLQAVNSSLWADEVVVGVTTSEEKITTLLDQNISKQIKIVSINQAEFKLLDFSTLRTRLLNACSHNWIFFLDSDEYFPYEPTTQLEKILAKTSVSAVSIIRQDFFLEKLLNYGEARQQLVRLIRKDDCDISGNVHETISAIKGIQVDSNVKIIHHAHTSVCEFIGSVSYYAQLAATNKPWSWSRLLEAVFFPPGKFIYNYFFRLGFADGYRGLVYATVMSLHSLFVRIYSYEKR